MATMRRFEVMSVSFNIPKLLRKIKSKKDNRAIAADYKSIQQKCVLCEFRSELLVRVSSSLITIMADFQTGEI